MQYISSKIEGSFDTGFFSVRQTESYSSDCYTALLIQRGSIEVQEREKNYVLSAGDIILLDPDKVYTLRSLSGNQVLKVLFDRRALDVHVPSGYRLQINSTLRDRKDYDQVIRIMEKIVFTGDSAQNPYTLTALFYQLLDALVSDCVVEISALHEDNIQDRIHDRVLKITNYIDQHYHQQLSLQKLADEVYLSPQYLSKFIKRHMGITFNHYLNQVRIEHAHEELIQTDYPITQIAFNNGFSNISTFNKLFHEKYGQSPTTCRLEQKRERTAQAKTNAPAGSAPDTEPDDSMDLDISFGGESKAFDPSWRDTVNIGSLSTALLPGFSEVFSRAQQALRFSYVRFSGIFAEEIMSPTGLPHEYDFSNLDQILDFFIGKGICPFIELSQKQPVYALSYPYAPRTDPPEQELSSEYVCDALAALMGHCLGRYGAEAVSKWRFEIWAKADDWLPNRETPQKYWQRFVCLSSIIKSFAPSCRVGGPGFNTAGDPEQFEQLLEEMERQQVLPDFFSIYIHFYEPFNFQIENEREPYNQFRILSTDPDFCSKTFRSYRNRIRKHVPEDRDLYVTELSSGLNLYDHVATSVFQAAFLFRNVAGLFRETPCIAYWHFSDLLYVGQYDPKNYTSGIGLLSVHGIPKPSYYSLEFLSRLGSGLVDCGEEYIAATDGYGQYQFMICHYVHYNREFCFANQYPMALDQTYGAFERAENRTVHLYLNDLPAGQYKCIRYTLNRDNGSVLDQFIRISEHGKLSPKEVNYMLLNMQEEEAEYYRRKAIPGMEVSYLDTVDHAVSLDLDLEPHEVILLRLEKQL